MKRYLLIAALAAAPAYADLVAAKGENELRLMDAPCTHEAILESIKPEYRDQFKRAQATLDKNTVAACWIDTNEGAYFVQFEGGQGLAFSITGFIEQGV